MRVIACADAFAELPNLTAKFPGAIVTSPPDAEELGITPAQYPGWLRRAMELCFDCGSPVLFYVTDRMTKGHRISKAEIAFDVAHKRNLPLIWHKIALRRDPGKTDLRRPGFSHCMAFGNAGAGEATPDAFMAGRQAYPNATGIVAARMMVEFALRHSDHIIDPFCGRGTIPAVAEALEAARATGIDIDPAQCEHAENLKLSLIA